MSNFKERFKWFGKEIMFLYSSKPSFFSKKRIESGIAFIIAQIGMIFYFMEHHSTMDMTAMMLWAGTEFTIAGYVVSHIEKAKRQKTEETEDEKEI